MKKSKIFRIILVSLVLVVAVMGNITVKAADSSNLIDKNVWTSNFYGTANGSLTSTGDNSFKFNMTSIGNGNDVWQAQAYIENILFKKGYTYTYSMKIESDIDRTITVKVQKNNAYESMYTDEVITLEANEEYEFSREFTPTEMLPNGKLVFGLAYNSQDTVSPNVSNEIKVSEISLIEQAPDFTALTYNAVSNNTVVTDASVGANNYSYSKYYFETTVVEFRNGGGPVHIVPDGQVGDDGQWTIFVAANEPVSKVLINGKESDFYQEQTGAALWIPVNNLVYEYNNVEIYGSGTNALGTVLIFKNGNVTNYRNSAITTVSGYFTTDDTEGMIKLLNAERDKVRAATTIAEIDKILKALPAKMEYQKEKDATISRINAYASEDKNPSNEVVALVNQALKDIDEITTKDELAAREQIFLNDVSLQLNKESTIKQLTEYIGKDYSDKVEAIYKKAVEDISKATTVEDVKKLGEEATKAIDEQIAKEEAEKTTGNPLTLDNVGIYFVLLIISGFGVYFSKHMLKGRRGN